MISKEGKAEERKWQIQSALSTLQRAEEIKNDTSLIVSKIKEVINYDSMQCRYHYFSYGIDQNRLRNYN